MLKTLVVSGITLGGLYGGYKYMSKIQLEKSQNYEKENKEIKTENSKRQEKMELVDKKRQESIPVVIKREKVKLSNQDREIVMRLFGEQTKYFNFTTKKMEDISITDKIRLSPYVPVM